MRITCGRIHSPNDTTDLLGHASQIPPEMIDTPTTTSDPNSCTCTGNVAVGSACSAIGDLTSLPGNYQPVCRTHDERLVYYHEEEDRLLYLYYQAESWLISPNIGSEFALYGASSQQMCADEIQTSPFYVFDGSVRFSTLCYIPIFKHNNILGVCARLQWLYILHRHFYFNTIKFCQ